MSCCVLCYDEPVALLAVDGETAEACHDHVWKLVEDDGAEIVDEYESWDAPASASAVYAELDAMEGQFHD